MTRARIKLLSLVSILLVMAVAWSLWHFVPQVMSIWYSQEVVPLKQQPDGRRDQPVLAVWDEARKKFGYINRFNEVVIDCQYDQALDFNDGIALVKEGKRASFINEQGKTVSGLPAGAVQAEAWQEGMAWYAPAGILGFGMRPYKWGLMQLDGKVIKEPTYPEVHAFHDGLAAVNVGAKWEYGFWMGGKWGYVNKQGVLVIPTTFNYASNFSEGLANVSDNQGTRFIDTTGKVVVAVTNGFAGSFREGLCPVRGLGVRGNDKQQTNYLDRTGKVVFTTDGWGEEFHEGLAVVKFDDKHGFINAKGTLTIPARYAEAFPFSDGLAAVRDKKTTVWGMGDQWGFIDKTGTLRIKQDFNEVHPFKNELSRVHLGGEMVHRSHNRPFWKGGEWWIIDISGKKLRRCLDWEKREW